MGEFFDKWDTLVNPADIPQSNDHNYKVSKTCVPRSSLYTALVRNKAENINLQNTLQWIEKERKSQLLKLEGRRQRVLETSNIDTTLSKPARLRT